MRKEKWPESSSRPDRRQVIPFYYLFIYLFNTWIWVDRFLVRLRNFCMSSDCSEFYRYNLRIGIFVFFLLLLEFNCLISDTHTHIRGPLLKVLQRTFFAEFYLAVYLIELISFGVFLKHHGQVFFPGISDYVSLPNSNRFIRIVWMCEIGCAKVYEQMSKCKLHIFFLERLDSPGWNVCFHTWLKC